MNKNYYFLLVFMVFSVNSYSNNIPEQNDYIIPYGFEGRYRTPQWEIGGHLIGGAIPSQRSAFFQAKIAGHEPWTKIHPLLQAILENPSEIESIVMESKVNLNQPINGKFPLYFAVSVESPKAVEELIKAGADVNLKMDSIMHGKQNEIFLHKMIEKIDPRLSDTTLSFTVVKDIIKVLVQYGADLSVKNYNGHTPYMSVIDIYSRDDITRWGSSSNGRVHNRMLKELMPLLRKGKSLSEIISELGTLIDRAESTYQRSRLKHLREQEFSILMELAKDEQERKNIRTLLKNSPNRPNLLSRAIGRCRLAFAG